MIKALKFFFFQRPWKAYHYTLTNAWVYRASSAAQARVVPITMWRFRFTRKWSIAIVRLDGDLRVLTP